MLAWKYCSHRTDFLCFNWDLREFFWISLDRFNYTAFLCKSAPFIVPPFAYVQKNTTLFSHFLLLTMIRGIFLLFPSKAKRRNSLTWKSPLLFSCHFSLGKSQRTEHNPATIFQQPNPPESGLTAISINLFWKMLLLWIWKPIHNRQAYCAVDTLVCSYLNFICSLTSENWMGHLAQVVSFFCPVIVFRFDSDWNG